MTQARAYAALDATSPLAPFALDRRDPGPRDVQIDILFCGVCHSDLHTARSEWPGTVYPCVPGHEIVGRVTKVGAAVTGFKAGDLAAVGCMVDSCQTCPSCRAGLEQYCEPGMTLTYNSPDKHLPGKVTYGGYSSQIVVDERFCLHVSDNARPRRGRARLCAGITTYSPLKHWGVGKGKKVGIVGLGGLGHMGVKLAHAFGAHTVLFTTSPGKIEDAKRLRRRRGRALDGRRRDGEARQQLRPHPRHRGRVAQPRRFLTLLKRDGTLVLVGVPEHPHPSPAWST